jgi:polyhydroxybutyrate depolymerase
MVLFVGAVTVSFCLITALASWFVGPSLRCEQPSSGSVQAGWSARRLVSGDVDRCYHLYVPSGYDPAQPPPLVVSYHGFLSSPNTNSLLTRWSKLAEQEGFLVAYPQGSNFPQRWDAGPTWGAAGVDDVQFFLDLLDDLSLAALVDPDRVYVNGFSNGGGMSVQLGCKAAGKVAALGSVAGAIVDTDDCSPSRPVPVMAFHGTDDPLVPYAGGPMEGWLLRFAAGATNAPVFFAGAPDWVAGWAEQNGCSAEPEAIPPQGDTQGIRYTGCDEGAQVIFHTIEDGGHTWPRGRPIPFMGKTSRDVDATEELWKFFQAHTLEDH